MSYPLDHARPDRTYTPPSITTSASWSAGSRGKASHRKRTSNAQGGSLAQPGKVLSKEDRQKRARASSATQPEPAKSFEEQRAEDLSFGRLYENLKSWRVLQAVNASFRDNLAPEAAATTIQELQSGIPLSPARHLIVLLISFLIVFGLGWNAITYQCLSAVHRQHCLLHDHDSGSGHLHLHLHRVDLFVADGLYHHFGRRRCCCDQVWSFDYYHAHVDVDIHFLQHYHRHCPFGHPIEFLGLNLDQLALLLLDGFWLNRLVQ
jgi:hypothetical protein